MDQNREPAAYQSFLDGRECCIEQMIHIRKLIDTELGIARLNKTDWRYSDDMEFVSAKLAEIEQFLGVYEND